MTNKTNPSYPTSSIDPYKFLQLKQNRDGSVTRLTQTPSTQASSDPNSTSLVLTKDCPLNTVDNTFLRLFLPKIALNPSSSSSKLPVIVYFHGGGFVFHHANSTMFHDFCSELAVFTSALVVSVEYRLAPEHRLPAAYDDSIDALRWIRNEEHEQDEWLAKYGDCSKCFLMGSSVGGNIAYIVGYGIVESDEAGWVAGFGNRV
ncbi:carboxylesterase 1-like [Silene latifolia]|uniref:carboxylesterase 1-like n=1 Tax=Silene latifolia TaxID=37657 RepID=UPI003D77A90E